MLKRKREDDAFQILSCEFRQPDGSRALSRGQTATENAVGARVVVADCLGGFSTLWRRHCGCETCAR